MPCYFRNANMKLLALVLALPIFAYANELQISCDLERSKAEVQASILGSPSVYGTVGQDPLVTSKNIILGVNQSLSGYKQAKKLRESAEAKCSAMRSTLLLDEYVRWSQLQVQHEGAKVELFIIERAILLAKSNISQLDAQLTAQTITIAEHTNARQTLVALESRQAELLRQLAIVMAVPPESNISTLLHESVEAEELAARLAAQAQAESAWDVVVSAGVRQPLDGSKAATYGTVAFKYSFGTSSAYAAASAVGKNTAKLLVTQEGGYTQTVERQRETLKGLVEAETFASATAARQIEHLSTVRASIVGIETALAQNTLRALSLQLKSLEADKVGADTRLKGYKKLIDQLS